jgi:hypothetical protein
MIEGKRKFREDDLSDFSDYLSQFNNAVGFDAEVCPVCGVNISESLALKKSPYIKLNTLKDKSRAIAIAHQLQLNGITIKVEEMIDNSVLERIDYLYQILVPIKDGERAKEIIIRLIK